MLDLFYEEVAFCHPGTWNGQFVHSQFSLHVREHAALTLGPGRESGIVNCIVGQMKNYHLRHVGERK